MIYFEKFSNTSYQIMEIINYILKDFTIYIINKDTRGGIPNHFFQIFMKKIGYVCILDHSRKFLMKECELLVKWTRSNRHVFSEHEHV